MNLSSFQKRKVQRLNWIKLFFFFSLLVVFSFLLTAISNMFISALLAVVLSEILRPMVDFIEEKSGWGRFSSTLLVFGIFSFMAVSLMMWALPFFTEQFQTLKGEIPHYIIKATELLDQAEEKIKTFIPENIHLAEQAKDFLIFHLTQLVQNLPRMITNSFSVFFLCSFLSFFMVKDSYKVMRAFLSMVPNHVFETTLNLTHQINKQVGKFIRVRILEAFIVGLITGIGLQIISFPFALLLGMFAGVMNLIPYLGPVIGFIPAFLIGLVNGLDLIDLSAVIVVYVTSQIIDNVVLIPIMVAKMMKLHPVTVVVLVAAGAQFMGILGMIISIPIANAIQVSYQAVYRHIIDAESTG